MIACKKTFVLTTVLFVVSLFVRLACAEVDWAPLFSSDTDVWGNQRVRVLGPFYETRHGESGRDMWAVRPLCSRQEDPAERKFEQNVLWPVWMGEKSKNEYQWFFLYIVNWQNYDVNNPDSRYHLWALPVYFQGRDAKGKGYVAVFPFGGVVREFLGRDRIGFVLFPIRLTYSVNDVYTSSWVWPIYARTTGGGHDRLRVFPFYGYAKLRNDYRKRFIMWPFWTDARYNYPGSSGSGYVLFPFYGHLQLENQAGWMFLPPFFRYVNGEKGGMLLCPWPFFKKRWGYADQVSMWPIFGEKKIENVDSSYFLWPISSMEKRYNGNETTYQFLVIPFVASRSRVSVNSQGERKITERMTRLWPLMSVARRGEDFRFNMLALWPFKPHEGVERNYAPLWSLYTHSRHQNLVEDELLWGLFKYRRDRAGSKKLSLFPFISYERDTIKEKFDWSILKGLLGYSRSESGRRYRLLYFISFGGRKED